MENPNFAAWVLVWLSFREQLFTVFIWRPSDGLRPPPRPSDDPHLTGSKNRNLKNHKHILFGICLTLFFGSGRLESRLWVVLGPLPIILSCPWTICEKILFYDKYGSQPFLAVLKLDLKLVKINKFGAIFFSYLIFHFRHCFQNTTKSILK